MNIEHYNEFIRFQEKGLKKQATESVRAFISSFMDDKEVQDWVWSYLPELKTNQHSRIRHETFVELVYPVLNRGYQAEEYKPTLWLGKLIQNIYQAPKLHEELNHITDNQLYRKCFKLNSEDNEVRSLLLQNIVQWLDYCIHEWPSGILYGNDGATLKQCQEIREEVEFAKKLDANKEYSDFFSDFEDMLIQYESRLNKCVN